MLRGLKSSQNSPKAFQIRARQGNSISTDSLKKIQQTSNSTPAFGGLTLHSNWGMSSDGLVHPGVDFLKLNHYRQHRPTIATRKGSGYPHSTLASGHFAARRSSRRLPHSRI
jgi:hypothetical protein